MAKKHPVENVPAEVHRFLSRNGRKGGQTTKKLIEAGKKLMEKREREGDEEDRDIDDEERSSYHQ